MAVAAERQEAAQRRELCISTREAGAVISLEALQGMWTEAQYLRLTDYVRRLLEFTDGRIEALPMPTDRHQVISRFLFLALFSFVRNLGGTVLYAPLRLRVRFPRDFGAGHYVSVRQVLGGREVGRVTWQFRRGRDRAVVRREP